MRVASSGAIRCVGGAGPLYTDSFRGPPSPGGGGSGGTILIQVPEVGGVQVAGTLDLSGGAGGTLRYTSFTGASAESIGGAGGYGQLRVESDVAPSASQLGTVVGPPGSPDQTGVLRDRDAWSGVQSQFRRTAAFGAPDWLHYVVTATVLGQTVVYSDDPANFNPANRPGQPIRFFVQGAQLDAAGNPVRTGPWREFVAGVNGLGADDVDAVRFLVLFDDSVGPIATVDDVAIHFRD